jgi:hypothetical protein
MPTTNRRHTETMNEIRVHNIPDEVSAVLQERASAAGQSMQEYVQPLLREERDSRRSVDDAHCELLERPGDGAIRRGLVEW